LTGTMASAIGKVHSLQRGQGTLASLFCRDTTVDHRQLDILDDVKLGQQIEELKYETNFAIANGCELASGGVLNRQPVEFDGAFGGRIQTAQDVHEGGFAAARWADDGDEFAFGNVERDVIERADFLVTETVDFADIAEFDERHGREG